MCYYRISLPIIINIVQMIYQNECVLNSYLFRLFRVPGIVEPLRLFISVITLSLTGIEFLSHYREQFPEIKEHYSGLFSVYCPEKIRDYVSRITNGMAARKLFLFQAYIVRTQCPELIGGGILDIDVITVRSASSQKEGAENGFNKKAKGKPCFQLSASFIAGIFVDSKLFPGSTNPKNFFRKAVKRAKSMGLPFKTVRADSAYLTTENPLFLSKLSLWYAIGAPATFSAVKSGIESFKKAARKKSSQIVSVAKGVAITDLGRVMIAPGTETRIIIVRRISRKKNRRTGKRKVRTYYYAIASNTDLPPAKLYAFYHKRQCIEAGFSELNSHWHLERLPFRSLKANEFWIACKIVAMTLFKIFQKKFLPKSLQHMLLKTFLRRILLKGLKPVNAGEVEIQPKAKNLWLLRRLLTKTERMKSALITRVSMG